MNTIQANYKVWLIALISATFTLGFAVGAGLDRLGVSRTNAVVDSEKTLSDYSYWGCVVNEGKQLRNGDIFLVQRRGIEDYCRETVLANILQGSAASPRDEQVGDLVAKQILKQSENKVIDPFDAEYEKQRDIAKERLIGFTRIERLVKGTLHEEIYLKRPRLPSKACVFNQLRRISDVSMAIHLQGYAEQFCLESELTSTMLNSERWRTSKEYFLGKDLVWELF